MLNDKDASDIASDATEHARAVVAARLTPRNALAPMRPRELATLLESAFIAGACRARRLSVVELDEVLANANATRAPLHMHQNCKTCRCPDPDTVTP